MKKISFLIILLLSCFLISCNELKFNLNVNMNITIIKDYNLDEQKLGLFNKYNELILDDKTEFVQNINEIEYKKISEIMDKNTYSKGLYMITINDYIVYIINEKEFVKNNTLYEITKNNFNFLDSYDYKINSDSLEINLSDIAFGSEIKLYSKEKDKYKNLKTNDDINSFKNSIKEIEYKKLDKDGTTIVNYLYKITSNNKTITIISKEYLNIDGEVYLITSGDFDFLNQYEYNESSGTGWLPWV